MVNDSLLLPDKSIGSVNALQDEGWVFNSVVQGASKETPGLQPQCIMFQLFLACLYNSNIS